MMTVFKIVNTMLLVLGLSTCSNSAFAMVNACGINVDHITIVNSACAYKVVLKNIDYAIKNKHTLRRCQINGKTVISLRTAFRDYNYAYEMPANPKKLGICNKKV